MKSYRFVRCTDSIQAQLDEVFTDYRKKVEQIDDVVVIGVKA